MNIQLSTQTCMLFNQNYPTPMNTSVTYEK